jgi:cytochrome c oxidase assembly protein subunit 15
MSQNVPSTSTAAPDRTVTVYRAAALFTFLAVAMGSVVCATKSGASCPTWPGCRTSQLTPQWQLSPVIEFTHRVVAVSAGPLLLGAGVLGARWRGGDRWLRVIPWIALVGALASGFFGRLVIVSTLSTPLAAVDLSCALLAMTLMAIAAVRIGTFRRSATDAEADTEGTADAEGAANAGGTTNADGATVEPHAARTRRWAIAGATTVIAMHVTGLFTASTGSYTGCLGWPLWRLISGDLHPWLQWVRLGLAALAAVIVVATVAEAFRCERLRPWGICLAALFAAEMVLGVVIGVHGLSNGVAATYSVVASALLWGLGLLTAVARTAPDAAHVAAPAPASAAR